MILADASILCTALGGDHNKDPSPVQIVDHHEFIIISSINFNTDLAYWGFFYLKFLGPMSAVRFYSNVCSLVCGLNVMQLRTEFRHCYVPKNNYSVI